MHLRTGAWSSILDRSIDQQAVAATRAIGVPLVTKKKVQQRKAKEEAPVKPKGKEKAHSKQSPKGRQQSP